MVSRLRLFLLCICLVLVARPALSQQAPQPSQQAQQPALLQMVTVQVKPGRNAMFEEYVDAVRTASKELGLSNYWLSAQSVSGGLTYTFAMQPGGWAAMSDPGPFPRFAEVFGPHGAAVINDLATDSIESVHTAFYQIQPNLSVPPAEGEGAGTAPDAVVFSEITLNPGMAPQYIETAAQTREAAIAVAPDLRYLVLAPGFGASAVIVVGFVESWSDLDTARPGPGQMVMQHYGQERGAAISARAQESIANIVQNVHRTRPDLNYQPEL